MEMFLNNMLTAAEQVAILYIIVLIGLIADITKIFTDTVAKQCTNLLFYIITPCVIIRSFLEIEHNADTTKGLFTAMGCGLILHSTAAIINIPWYRKGNPDKNAIFRFAAVFGNCGYMSLPIVSAVVGTEGVFYCSAVVMTFQIFSFTHGIALMAPKSSAKREFKIRNIIINPGTIAVIVGLPLFLLNFEAPKIVLEPIKYVATMNTPLAMLIFGTYLSKSKFSTVLKEKKLFVAMFAKLIALPLILLGVYTLLGLKGAILTSLIIPASAPPANNTMIFAAKYGKDPALAAQVVAAISVVSIITIPFMIALSKML